MIPSDMHQEHKLFLETLNTRLADLCSRISREARNYSLLLKQEEYEPSNNIRDYRIYCAFNIFSHEDPEGLPSNRYLLMQFVESLFDSEKPEMQQIRGNDAHKWLSYLRSKGISIDEMLSIREINLDMFVHVRRDLRLSGREVTY